MASKVAVRCWRSSSAVLQREAGGLIGFPERIVPQRWEWLGSQQRRWFAAPTEQKAAAPNAAKASKAKSAAKTDGKESKKDHRERFNDLIDACLNAPSPVRALKEKDRIRLAEMEKLGVITKEREREIEQEKAKGKAAKNAAKKLAKAKPVEETDLGDAEIDTPTAETPMLLTAEEGKRLAKEQSRVMLKEDRERAKGESIRLQLKKEALAALPPHLREAAMVPDLTPFPKSRIPASLTPPIGGYIEDRAKQAAQSVSVKKSSGQILELGTGILERSMNEYIIQVTMM
ncbi:hypothetical protein AXG93_1335s1360 [Marchantia polymorpha subsp. ruderalis]|uniref:Uncharacterized protein n=1 Tax=Marchantia polymorpha subsp. ruderalis TaxID=1480154 RepID=A0A176W6M8_MARPO|nr:hypothetical protein AXG93_1335s1360 [Marchantia polymorpha subsp. ruderalis]